MSRMRRRRNAIQVKTAGQLASMRQAGLVVAEALSTMRDACAPGVSTADLDGLARDVLRRAGATSSFLGYDIGFGPFSGVICASINDKVVHGVPAATEVLADGDLISLDFGAIIDGWHGDAAITVPVGAVSEQSAALSEACERALWAGLAQACVGARIGDISHAVQTSVEAAGAWGIVEGYGGHGIGSAMHMDPHILNYGAAGTGPRLTAGMAVAIEPMLTAGGPGTRQMNDGWTVRTIDGSRAVHWEHTVAVMDDGPWVLTAEDGGRARLAAGGITVSAQAG